MNLDIAKFALNWEVFSVIIFSERPFQIYSTSHFLFLSRLIFKRLNSYFFIFHLCFYQRIFFYVKVKIFHKKCIFRGYFSPKKRKVIF